jgi:hypothetical protein
MMVKLGGIAELVNASVVRLQDPGLNFCAEKILI